MIKLSIDIIISRMKMEHPLLKSCIGNGTFELGYGTPAKSGTMEKRQSAGATVKATAKERYHKRYRLGWLQ
jgi:hypothetical protein